MTTTYEQSNMTTTGPATPSAPDGNSPMKWVKRGIIGLVAIVALVYAGIFFYANVLNDSPDALDENSLAEALAEPAEQPAAAETISSEPTTESAAPASAAPEGSTAPAVETVATNAPAAGDTPAADVDGFDGVWTPTTASEFGYRVDEILGGVNVTAVGRSNEIEGSLTIDDTTATVDVVVQVANITSDNGTRDGQFRGRIMDVANFPTATFRTTQPVDFGLIPATGESVTATAVGELTLKGVTQTVTLEVTAQSNGSNVGVLGNIPITFTDYGIDNPSNSAVSLEDEGVVEFVLVFERS